MVKPRYAFFCMLSGWLVSLFWLLAGWSQQLGASASYPLGIEPMYPGLAASLLVWGTGLVARSPDSPGASQ
jgi:hypothetical protein